MNHTGRFIWTALRSGASLDSVCSDLAAAFGIDTSVAERDVDALIATWKADSLIGPAPAVHAPIVPNNVVPNSPSVICHYALNGISFCVRADVAAGFLAEVAPRLQHLEIPPPRTPDFTFTLVSTESSIVVFRDETVLSVEESMAAARTILLHEITRLSAPGREWLALMHAAACGTGSRCLLLPAASYSGKTTLAAVLASSGLMFYADDFVGLEKATLRVPPMPFPLALREGSWPVLHNRFPGFEELSVHSRPLDNVRFLCLDQPAAPEPAEATGMIFAQWHAGAKTSFNPLSTLEAVIQLKEAGYWVEHIRGSIEVFVRWLDQLPKAALIYSNVDEAAVVLAGMLNSRS